MSKYFPWVALLGILITLLASAVGYFWKEREKAKKAKAIETSKKESFKADLLLECRVAIVSWGQNVEVGNVEKLLSIISSDNQSSLFGISTGKSTIYAEFQQYRHNFSINETIIIDNLLGYMQLYEIFYDAIISAEFSSLPVERQYEGIISWLQTYAKIIEWIDELFVGKSPEFQNIALEMRDFYKTASDDMLRSFFKPLSSQELVKAETDLQATIEHVKIKLKKLADVE